MRINVTTLGMALGIIIARRIHIEVDEIAKQWTQAHILIKFPSIMKLLGVGNGWYWFTVGDLAYIGVTLLVFAFCKFVIKQGMPLVVALTIYIVFFEIYEVIFGTIIGREDQETPETG